MAGIKLPFSLEKPSATEFVTSADAINYDATQDVKTKIDNLEDKIDKKSEITDYNDLANKPITWNTNKNGLLEGADTLSVGSLTHTSGYGGETIGNYSTTEGSQGINVGSNTHIEGDRCHIIDRNPNNSNGAHAEGINGTAQGYGAHIEGYLNNYLATISNVEDTDTSYEKKYTFESVLEKMLYKYVWTVYSTNRVKWIGQISEVDVENKTYTITSNSGYTEEGTYISYDEVTPKVGDYMYFPYYGAVGNGAHAEGVYTQAFGEGAHAEGDYTSALADSAHAEGVSTVANGVGSHTEGYATETNNDYEHAEGIYNISTKKTDSTPGTISSVGMGTRSSRKNAMEINSNGEMFVLGIGGYEGNNMTSAKSLKDSLTEGSYVKPEGGIPKSDLTSDVQASLDKADTAILDISGKQDTITDLETIRSGAALGATALQEESHLGDYTKPDSGIPKSDLEASVLASLDKADTAIQDISNKLDVISDLETIRSGAALGATSILDISGKLDIISDLSTIRSGAALGATAVQPEEGKGLFSGSYTDLTNKLVAGDGILIVDTTISVDAATTSEIDDNITM